MVHTRKILPYLLTFANVVHASTFNFTSAASDLGLTSILTSTDVNPIQQEVCDLSLNSTISGSPSDTTLKYVFINNVFLTSGLEITLNTPEITGDMLASQLIDLVSDAYPSWTLQLVIVQGNQILCGDYVNIDNHKRLTDLGFIATDPLIVTRNTRYDFHPPLFIDRITADYVQIPITKNILDCSFVDFWLAVNLNLFQGQPDIRNMQFIFVNQDGTEIVFDPFLLDELILRVFSTTPCIDPKNPRSLTLRQIFGKECTRVIYQAEDDLFINNLFQLVKAVAIHPSRTVVLDSLEVAESRAVKQANVVYLVAQAGECKNFKNQEFYYLHLNSPMEEFVAKLNNKTFQGYFKLHVALMRCAIDTIKEPTNQSLTSKQIVLLAESIVVCVDHDATDHGATYIRIHQNNIYNINIYNIIRSYNIQNII